MPRPSPAPRRTILLARRRPSINSFDSQCAVYSWTGGFASREFTANCCVTSTWICINGNDWSALLNAGKLDGLRYEKATKDSTGARVLEFRKVSGTAPVSISSEGFSK